MADLQRELLSLDADLEILCAPRDDRGFRKRKKRWERRGKKPMLAYEWTATIKTVGGRYEGESRLSMRDAI
ncbi:MAG TPA: hypothetical protein VES97_06055 [Solirubrobacteraceae bacterium]|nr:hypothetical protein [Solirubrobacteraceae bacterium]